jgi:hypothetical protein
MLSEATPNPLVTIRMRYGSVLYVEQLSDWVEWADGITMKLLQRCDIIGGKSRGNSSPVTDWVARFLGVWNTLEQTWILRAN